MKKKRAAKEKWFNLPAFFTKETIVVSALLLLALILRLIYLSHLKTNDPSFYLPTSGTDMLTYHNYALQILSGTPDKEPYYYGPLYFYFLAAIYKIFGVDPYIARLIQMLLGVATSLLIYLIARRVFNKTVATVSLTISIFYGMFYIHEGVLLIEPLATFLNTLAIFLLLRIEDKPSYKNIALSGIAIGLSALVRANILLFIPFIFIWMLRFAIRNSRFAILKRFGFLCLVILLTISPVTIRNYLVSGKFVLISTNGPVNLWIGNNPYAEGWFAYPPSEYSDKVSRKVGEKGDKAYIEEVTRFAKEYPSQFFGLLFKKFLLFWDSTEIANNINYELYKDLSIILKMTFISFGLIGSLALLGIFLSLKAWRKNLLLNLFILSSMLATVLFFVTARHRISIIPLLIPFAGFAIWWWVERIKAKRIQTIFLSVSFFLFPFSLTHSRMIEGYLAPYIHPDGFRIRRENKVVIRDDSGLPNWKDYYLLQSPTDMIRKELIIKEDLNKFKEAVFFFNFEYIAYTRKTQKSRLIFEVNGKEQEVNIVPTQYSSFYPVYFSADNLNQGKNTVIIKPKTRFDCPLRIYVDSLCSFGRSYFFNKEGEWERLKKGEYIIWLSLNPERSAEGFMAQGINYYKERRYNEATLEFHGALSKDSNCVNAHYNLGLIYEKIGKLDKAIEEYKEELELATKKGVGREELINMHDNLIRLYYTKRMWDEMLKESCEIVRLDPNHINAHSNIASVYFNRGIFEKAYTESQKILELDPNNTYAKQMLEAIETKNLSLTKD